MAKQKKKESTTTKAKVNKKSAKKSIDKKKIEKKKPVPVINRRKVSETLMSKLREDAVEFATFKGDKDQMKRVEKACEKNDIKAFSKTHGTVSGHAGTSLYFDMSGKGLALSDKKEKIGAYPFFWTMKECFKAARFYYANLMEKAA